MTGNEALKIGGLLLAAGGSSRLGQPKQLMRFEGQTLLRRAALALLESSCHSVVVVLGAEIEGSLAEIDDLSLRIVVNTKWQDGMSSSIKSGLDELLRVEPDLDAVMITLCDQPKISHKDIDRFADKFRKTGAAIVASVYDEVRGVPALFSCELFAQLSDLVGDKGARDLMRGHADVAEIPLPQAEFDIDTESDIAKYNQRLL